MKSHKKWARSEKIVDYFSHWQALQNWLQTENNSQVSKLEIEYNTLLWKKCAQHAHVLRKNDFLVILKTFNKEKIYNYARASLMELSFFFHF